MVDVGTDLESVARSPTNAFSTKKNSKNNGMCLIIKLGPNGFASGWVRTKGVCETGAEEFADTR